MPRPQFDSRKTTALSDWGNLLTIMILLLGATGYVGGKYAAYLSQKGVAHRAVSRSEVDYTRMDPLVRMLRDLKPTFLINAAGYTGKPNVDACELFKWETLEGNAVFPGVLREACEATKTPWGHVSSGCIYQGRRDDGEGFTEDDVPNFSFRTNNCSFYSGTKALGEEVLEGAEQCYIWRLRIPFNHEDNPRNYLTKLMRYRTLLEAENSISHLEEFVASTFACWEQRVPFGRYNVTNPGSVMTSDVVRWIREEGEVRLRRGELNPFPSEFQFFESLEQFMAVAAKTPRSNCVLDDTKLTSVGISMTPVESIVKSCLRQWAPAKI
jgi:dTDP-4-dehydrorhamnose reductase